MRESQFNLKDVDFTTINKVMPMVEIKWLNCPVWEVTDILFLKQTQENIYSFFQLSRIMLCLVKLRGENKAAKSDGQSDM